MLLPLSGSLRAFYDKQEMIIIHRASLDARKPSGRCLSSSTTPGPLALCSEAALPGMRIVSTDLCNLPVSPKHVPDLLDSPNEEP